MLVLVPSVASAAEGLQLIPNFTLLLAMMAGFIVLIYPLNVLLFKPIFAVLDERAEKIQGARQQADALQRQADDVLARYREAVSQVRQEAEQARRGRLDEARREQSSITSEARAAAEAELGRTRTELSSAIDDTRTALREQVEDLARQAAERIVGRPLS